VSAVATLIPRQAELDGGVTFAQAMEAHRLSNEESLAVPSVAHRMGINYEVMCKLLYGLHWPAAHYRWSAPFDKTPT
jgi:hypothetical protein